MDRRILNTVFCPPDCSHRYMQSIPYCIYSCAPEDEPTRYETCRRQEKLNINLENCVFRWRLLYNCIIKVKVSRYRPGVVQSFPGDLGSQICITFGIWRWWGRQPHAPAAFTPRNVPGTQFSLGAESTPEPWCGRREYVMEKSSDTTGNRSRDRPTSSAAP